MISADPSSVNPPATQQPKLSKDYPDITVLYTVASIKALAVIITAICSVLYFKKHHLNKSR